MADNRKWAAPVVVLVVLMVLVGLIWRWETQRESAPALATQPTVQARPAASQDNIYLFFSPRGNATDAVVEQIDQAKSTLHIQAYQFTSAPIAEAVVHAQKRGVQIVVVLDPSQESERYHIAQFLHNAAIPVYIDRKHAIAHNKIMLIDGRAIITGSFNFTKAGEQSNAENMLILFDKPDLYAAYEKNFQAHLRHSDKYEGRPAQKPAEQAPSRTQNPRRPSRQPAPTR
jgi:phosphatidylserine/phosphatidylglycerophosphate/cardiolipin synthase-like enzyme